MNTFDKNDQMPFGLIVGDDLREIIDSGIILSAKPDALTPISIDVRLHNRILTEKQDDCYITKFSDKPNLMDECFLNNRIYNELKPGEFILAGLNELVNLPNNVTAVFHLRSSLARLGVNHSISIHMMPGWSGRLTLELTNGSRHNYIELYDKMDIGTMMFYKHKMTQGYSGKYQNQTEIRC